MRIFTRDVITKDTQRLLNKRACEPVKATLSDAENERIKKAVDKSFDSYFSRSKGAPKKQIQDARAIVHQRASDAWRQAGDNQSMATPSEPAVVADGRAVLLDRLANQWRG